jgi:acetolactate synthase-1/2/3 large subunit
MKLSDYVIDSLARQGVTHIFEVCGGALAHLLNSLYGRTDITTVSMHHEMAAAIAAEGYARASENMGVAMATSGPGATNLITGIGSCYFDSIPCVFITGQVNTYEYKSMKDIRQIGFQETDIVNIVKPIVKKATMVTDKKDINYILEEAYDIAKHDRPGPVLLDIPLNIQREDVDIYTLKGYYNPQRVREIFKEPVELYSTIARIQYIIEISQRPVILVGGGVRAAHACKELREFAHTTRIPVVSSLMGLDAFPHDDPLFVGMIGTYGNRYANFTIANADLVLVFGARLDTRQTGTKPETFAREATLVQVDIDPKEFKDRATIPVQADIRNFLKLANKDHGSPLDYTDWKSNISIYKQKYPDYTEPEKTKIDPNWFFHVLSEVLPEDTIICVDVGQIQMWAAQSLRVKENQRFLTEGGMASIGSALPMAIGASFAKPGKMIVAIIGDGGFQLNIQELQTVYHHQLPVKIILLNNNGYGMIKQFQEQYMNSRFQSSGIGYSTPDFQDVVSAYKIPARKITYNNEIMRAVSRLVSDMRPEFLEVVIDPESRVHPKLAVNRPVEDQEPLLQRKELEANMIIELLPE